MIIKSLLFDGYLFTIHEDFSILIWDSNDLSFIKKVQKQLISENIKIVDASDPSKITYEKIIDLQIDESVNEHYSE